MLFFPLFELARDEVHLTGRDCLIVISKPDCVADGLGRACAVLWLPAGPGVLCSFFTDTYIYIYIYISTSNALKGVLVYLPLVDKRRNGALFCQLFPSHEELNISLARNPVNHLMLKYKGRLIINMNTKCSLYF